MAYLLQQLLTASAARAPRRPAVAVGERVLTYAELDTLSSQVARALLAQGVVPGDRVGILAPKSAAAVVALYGVLKTGACYIPLDPKSPAPRLAAIMNDSGVAVLLADQAATPAAGPLSASVPRLRPVIPAGPHGGRPAAGETAPASTGPELVSWEAVLAQSSGELAAGELPGGPGIETDLAYILYT